VSGDLTGGDRQEDAAMSLAISMMRTLTAVIGATILSTSAPAAGIDPRGYTCADLQSVIASRGYVFLSQPAFGDFVVANLSYCSGGSMLQTRSVPTRDNPECNVNYCANADLMRGGGM
jgi:hypothetical protein